MAKDNGKSFSREEVLQKIFEDSSDSDEDYTSEAVLLLTVTLANVSSIYYSSQP